MKKNKSPKKLIVANWKMNPESAESAKKLVGDIKRKVSRSKKCLIVLCPPAIFFAVAKGRASSKKVKFGLQNVHHEKKGSFTGEISASMAQNMGADYVIVGHSERRAMGETDEIICKKVVAVLNAGMTPILCVGEKEIDENADHLEFIEEQLNKGLDSVSVQDIGRVVIAYEPVYAIGGSKTIEPHLIYQRNIFIKKILTKKYDKEKAFSVLILYGGSVTVDNSKETIRSGSVDGFLIGHESLRADDFGEIVSRVESI